MKDFYIVETGNGQWKLQVEFIILTPPNYGLNYNNQFKTNQWNTAFAENNGKVRKNINMQYE